MSKYYEMMSIYENGNNHVFLTIDEKSEPKGEYCSERGVYLIDEKLYHFNCDSEKGNVFTDYLYNDLNWLIFSEKTLKIFDELEVEYQAIEISITPDAPCKYYIINLLSSVEGLDESESKYRVLVEDDKGSNHFVGLPRKDSILLENRVKGIDIFRVKDDKKGCVIVSDKVKNRFEREKITGINYLFRNSRYAVKSEGIILKYLGIQWGECKDVVDNKIYGAYNYRKIEGLNLTEFITKKSLWRLRKIENRKLGTYFELYMVWGLEYAVCVMMSGTEEDIEDVVDSDDVYDKIVPKKSQIINQVEIVIPRVLLPHILRDIEMGISRLYHESGVLYFIDMQEEKLYAISCDVIGAYFKVVGDLYVLSKTISSGLSSGVYPYTIKGYTVKGFSPQGRERELRSVFSNIKDIPTALCELKKILESCEESLNPKELEYRPIEESMRGKKMGEMEQNPLETFLFKERIESLEHFITKEFFEFYDYFEHGGGGTRYKLAKHEIISLYILNKQSILIRKRYYDSYNDHEHNPQTLEELRKQPPHENQQIIVPIEMLEPWFFAKRNKLNREFILKNGIFYYNSWLQRLSSKMGVNQHNFSGEEVSNIFNLMKVLRENKDAIINHQKNRESLFYKDGPIQDLSVDVFERSTMSSDLITLEYRINSKSIFNILNHRYLKLDMNAIENRVIKETQVPELIYILENFSQKDLYELQIVVLEDKYERVPKEAVVPFWECIFHHKEFEIFRFYCAEKFNVLAESVKKHIKEHNMGNWLSKNWNYKIKVENAVDSFCKIARVSGGLNELKLLLESMTKEELNRRIV